MTVTLLDTGVLYAAIDSSDTHHQVCARLLTTLPGRLLIPSTVLTETSWHVEKKLGAKREAAFLAAVASGELEIAELTAPDISRASDIVATHRRAASSHRRTCRAAFVDSRSRRVDIVQPRPVPRSLRCSSSTSTDHSSPSAARRSTIRLTSRPQRHKPRPIHCCQDQSRARKPAAGAALRAGLGHHLDG